MIACAIGAVAFLSGYSPACRKNPGLVPFYRNRRAMAHDIGNTKTFALLSDSYDHGTAFMKPRTATVALPAPEDYVQSFNMV